MDDAKELPAPKIPTLPTTSSDQQAIDEADAAIAGYLSDEFSEHLDECFAEGKRKALDELESRRLRMATMQSHSDEVRENEGDSELQAANQRYSTPEFRDEITRLFGEAKDQAIRDRDTLAAKNQQHE